MIILVDKDDNPIGTASKTKVHKKGLLHRAFSIFIINSKGEILIQQRAFDKYHSPGLWTNTCCSHPMPEEETLNAAKRRLKEEMGLSANLKFLLKFQYKAEFENGLIEHEIDHVYIGYSNDQPQINLKEVNDYKYLNPSEVLKKIKSNPEEYTVWFKIIFKKLMAENVI